MLHLLALAFHDNAFDSPYLDTPAKIYSSRVPDRMVSLPLHWKATIRDTPIFRAAVRSDYGWTTSRTDGVMSKQMSDWLQRIGKEAGFFPPPKLYSIRRGAGSAIDSE